MKRATCFFLCAVVLIAFFGSAIIGKMLASGVLHPMARHLTPMMIQASEHRFQEIGATPKDFQVTASDGVILRGWTVHTSSSNGDWVLLFHGVSDNRTGMTGQAA